MSRETDCRKSDWKPGVPVILADGGVWHFSRPRITQRVFVDADTRKASIVTEVLDRSATYGAALDTLDRCSDADYMLTLTALSLELLAENYDIPNEAVPELFVYEVGSDASRSIWDRIRLAVAGRTPIPKAD
jgi:hypothetical protein